MSHGAVRAESMTGVQQAERLAAWLRGAGVEDSGAAVDVADVLAASNHLQRLVEQLLTLDPRKPDEAERGLSLVTEMRAWMFTEMKPHLEALVGVWDAIEARLDALAPPEE